MSDFLEKLKKGMGAKNAPELKTEQDQEILPEESCFVTTPIEESDSEFKASGTEENQKTVLASNISETKKKTAKKGKIKLKPSIEKKEKSIPTEKDGLFEQEGELTVDVFETEKNIIIQSAVAGIDAEELEIYIEKDMVSIRGRREKQIEEKAENYFYQECYWGRFSREVILPVETDTSRSEAVIKNGILTITIPKISREKIKKLGIKEIE